MTIARITQAGNEVWHVGTSSVRFTQLGGEVWLSYPSKVRVTQIGLEVWRSVGVYVASVGLPTGSRRVENARLFKRKALHAAFGAAHKRRVEVTPIALVVTSAPTQSQLTKADKFGRFLHKRAYRKRIDVRRDVVIAPDLASTLASMFGGGKSKSEHFARFFRHKPPTTRRRKSAVLDGPVSSGLHYAEQRVRQEFFFHRKRTVRHRDLRKSGAPVPSYAEAVEEQRHPTPAEKLREFFTRKRPVRHRDIRRGSAVVTSYADTVEEQRHPGLAERQREFFGKKKTRRTRDIRRDSVMPSNYADVVEEQHHPNLSEKQRDFFTKKRLARKRNPRLRWALPNNPQMTYVCVMS